MATVNFGGLATGFDTNSIIKALLEAERQPITRMERDKSYYQNRLKAFKDFDGKLKSLMEAVRKIDTAKEMVINKANLSGEGFVKVSADAQALAGTYALEVVSLARQEKEVSTGVANGWISAGGELTVNGQTITVGAGSSLGKIRDLINANPDAGVTASLVNDGTATPNRLVLTAKTAGEDGVKISANTLDLDFPAAMTQAGSRAHVKVDGISIYGTSNSITGAIPGVTIDLLKPNAVAGETTNLTVGRDNAAIKGQIDGFIKAYNDVFSFVQAQKDSSWGTDPSLRSVQGRLRGMLVSSMNNSGSFQSLAALGFKTDKESGLLSVDATTLTNAIDKDLDSVVKLFAGETGVEGVAKQFETYLKGITDFVDGIYAGKKKSTDSSVKQIDKQIERFEARMSQREATLRARFDAMETLVSGMNAQSSFLAQQMTMLSNMSGSR